MIGRIQLIGTFTGIALLVSQAVVAQPMGGNRMVVGTPVQGVAQEDQQQPGGKGKGHARNTATPDASLQQTPAPQLNTGALGPKQGPSQNQQTLQVPGSVENQMNVRGHGKKPSDTSASSGDQPTDSGMPGMMSGKRSGRQSQLTLPGDVLNETPTGKKGRATDFTRGDKTQGATQTNPDQMQLGGKKGKGPDTLTGLGETPATSSRTRGKGKGPSENLGVLPTPPGGQDSGTVTGKGKGKGRGPSDQIVPGMTAGETLTGPGEADKGRGKGKDRLGKPTETPSAGEALGELDKGRGKGKDRLGKPGETSGPSDLLGETGKGKGKDRLGKPGETPGPGEVLGELEKGRGKGRGKDALKDLKPGQETKQGEALGALEKDKGPHGEGKLQKLDRVRKQEALGQLPDLAKVVDKANKGEHLKPADKAKLVGGDVSLLKDAKHGLGVGKELTKLDVENHFKNVTIINSNITNINITNVQINDFRRGIVPAGIWNPYAGYAVAGVPLLCGGCNYLLPPPARRGISIGWDDFSFSYWDGGRWYDHGYCMDLFMRVGHHRYGGWDGYMVDSRYYCYGWGWVDGCINYGEGRCWVPGFWAPYTERVCCACQEWIPEEYDWVWTGCCWEWMIVDGGYFRDSYDSNCHDVTRYSWVPGHYEYYEL
jgi:hypothetical protein